MINIAAYGPQLDSFDYIAVEETLADYFGAPIYSVPSGFGLQGTMALYLFMRNTDSEIHVHVPPDPSIVNPWWRSIQHIERIRLIPVRGNSQLAVATSVLRSATDLVAFAEFDEQLPESESGDNAIAWRLVDAARFANKPTTVRVLRPKEESRANH